MESSISTISKPVIDRLGMRNRRPSNSESRPEEERGRTTGVDKPNDHWEAGLRFRDPSIAMSSAGHTEAWESR